MSKGMYPRKVILIICPTCNLEKPVKSTRAKYCSKKCYRKAYRKEYYKLHKKYYQEYKVEYRNNNKEYLQEYQLGWLYGVSLDQFNQIKFDQDYCCAICGINESDLEEITGKKLQLDHDHRTGRIRGALCGPCNRFIGAAKENLRVLLNAVSYLKLFN